MSVWKVPTQFPGSWVSSYSQFSIQRWTKSTRLSPPRKIMWSPPPVPPHVTPLLAPAHLVLRGRGHCSRLFPKDGHCSVTFHGPGSGRSRPGRPDDRKYVTYRNHPGPFGPPPDTSLGHTISVLTWTSSTTPLIFLVVEGRRGYGEG